MLTGREGGRRRRRGERIVRAELWRGGEMSGQRTGGERKGRATPSMGGAPSTGVAVRVRG